MVEVEKQDSDWLDSCFWRFQDNVQCWTFGPNRVAD